VLHLERALTKRPALVTPEAYAWGVRVVIADPPAFTPPYDHELATALAHAGAEVELVTSRFRFGEAPTPAGYTRSELFYPASSRLFRRSRLRLPLKICEHPLGMARLAHRRADVLHFQWLALPQLDRLLLPRGVPLVFTAHDLLPRRSAGKRELWRKLLARFNAIVVHSERGRETLETLGVPAERLHVIFHPVFASDPARSDDGRTLLSLGVIRPYKGLADAIEVTRTLAGAHLLVAGDPFEPVERYREQAGKLAEWRLGYLPEREIDRALGETTVALFPYLAELDQSGALLRALGAGVPAVVYDVGGLAEPVRAYDAGAVVPAGDVEAMSAAVGELLANPEALERARAGALRARSALSWDEAASRHLTLYDALQ
jgi:glycosyltransferase involved in cell wall biosynthesis